MNFKAAGNHKIPVTIVTGFLGSGKTTIISHLIEYLNTVGQKVVYIKNELGAEDLDTEIIGSIFPTVKTQELTIGIAHHTPLGSIGQALNEVVEKYHPDRIIIETAGSESSADPVSLSILLDNHPKFFRDGLLSIIDVVNFEGYDQLEDYTKDKTKFVDLIVLNKIELVDQARREAVVSYIREYNESSPIIEAINGNISPLVAFGIDMNQVDMPKKIKLYEDHIEAINYVSNKIFDKSKVENVFKNFPKNVFRYKGYVRFPDATEIVSGVNKRFDWFPKSSSQDEQHTKLIIVGYHLENEKDKIFSMLDSCQLPDLKNG